MGLLDNVLGELAGGGGNASPVQGVLMSLLANQGGANQGANQSGGGLGGALGGLLGGSQAPSPGAAAGGIAGLIGQFEQAGLGNIVQSWVGSGQNQPVSPQQVEHALGPDQTQSMADQAGIPKQNLLGELAQALPGLVDRLTPNGRLPSAQELQGGGSGTIEV